MFPVGNIEVLGRGGKVRANLCIGLPSSFRSPTPRWDHLLAQKLAIEAHEELLYHANYWDGARRQWAKIAKLHRALGRCASCGQE